MKVIDLLNKIANGEEVPKKIKFCFRTFEYNGIADYLCIDKNDYSKEDYCNGYSIHKWIFGNNLNDEVTIIKEEKSFEEELRDNILKEIAKDLKKHKIPEKIIIGKKHPVHRIKKIEKKINEILDYLSKEE